MSPWRILLAVHERLITILGNLVGLIIAAVAILISLEVFMRNTGLGGIDWLNEAIEYSFYVGTFAAAPWALHQGAHVRVDLVLNLLPKRAAVAVEKLADAVGAGICLVLVYYGIQSVLHAYVSNSIQYKTLAVPEWPLFAVVPICALLLAVEFVARFARAAQVDDGTASRAGC